MLPLRGLACLLLMQSLGEVLARALSLPFPGPVVGMLLLLPALSWAVVREAVAACADALLQPVDAAGVGLVALKASPVAKLGNAMV